MNEGTRNAYRILDWNTSVKILPGRARYIIEMSLT
jgi:hypothetical protein